MCLEMDSLRDEGSTDSTGATVQVEEELNVFELLNLKYLGLWERELCHAR